MTFIELPEHPWRLAPKWDEDETRVLLFYAQTIREQALEEAAKVCESEYDNWDNERPLRICATTIRNLK